MLGSYGEGMLACIAISIAIALIAYGLGLTPFDPWNIPAWLFGLPGVYTIVYALTKSRESAYHLIWGAIMLAITIVSMTYNVLNPMVILGSLILVIVIIGLLGYRRERKS
ncbi:MAG: hypothetical protein J7J19_04800 [Thaumarchaeota archaeon]|nr:hypothetical protein [Nitrososphaerota archaeon]